VHKAQGSTLTEVMLDIRSRRKWCHMHYVAVSPATKLSGLHLKDFDASQIAVSSDTVREMERLRKEKLVELCYVPVYNFPSSDMNIIFLNAQSLHLHFNDVKCDPNFFSAAHLIGFAETRTKSDDVHDYEIPSFGVHRNDDIKHHGLITYIKYELMDWLTNVSYPNIEYTLVRVTNPRSERSCIIVFLYKSPATTLDEFKQMVPVMMGWGCMT